VVVVLAATMWLGMAVSVLAMVFAAIFAGRGQRMWQVFPLLLLEVLLGGASIVFWMFLVWFSTKAVMSAGISASIALVVALATGMALAVISVLASTRLIRAGYTMFGLEDRFHLDFGNSRWIGRSSTWRPNDLKRS